MTLTETPSPNDHDEYWKDAFDAFLPDLLQLLAPDVAAMIDWPRGAEAIQHGLFPDALESTTGARYPDRVYKVFLRSGEAAVLFLHFEFEAGRKNDFPTRVLIYRMRLFVKLRAPIFTLALLLDSDPRYRPDEYVETVFGNELRFRFASVKLLDFANQEEEFLASDDPAKILIAIKLADIRLRDPDARLAEKKRMLRILAKRIRENPARRALTRFLIQGIMTTQSRDREFHDEVLMVEQEFHVPFMTIYEKEAMAKGEAIGEARGEARGKRVSIEQLLRARFHEVPPEVADGLSRIENIESLDRLLVAAIHSLDMSTFVSHLAAEGPTRPSFDT